ncbi:MAG: valine--tRNA ligase [Gammaproteobacteria bacterium RIFCSPLOWO2_02_FULL_42_14]|nr:MAG: valine--tRNA ligase [Gammaproteobacteria bacterium RIFCSPHIGHO2_02_FULL_42_43]OGT27715.1 MAG: valine--tRNA ligase [Gammaproteobacteria bacterium RIFCSPHIGHO2_01_FULL_42_8]OGT52570.1 MAG: valine--tRNA ligase [Gammaproteobacteria bacterium RIFCSPHIGHO2_12_FULL_41_25]OGT63168.1 MAG: valine--tRNA ligase [Gammaproteobacteria bacterium RIFCSPLOWO2_02_FULL_42_14]OGT86668.1 MAG: valine--tRNA ligase [Gammaproteobacteria bacterium RIFCSPLOWO2_12_FULL_42_18]
MTEIELNKIYEPHHIESKWARDWETQGFFKPTGAGHAYCIMLPPPNVTGTLHMGHGFQYTLMDTLIRFHRMQGENVLWQAGTDHAGIATQMVVERQLAQQNISRHDLGRDAFLKKVWEWRHQSGQTITQQIRRLGASMDWSRERFTMDDNISHATITAFMRLHEEGLIYRGKKLVNWDPQLKTAISDLEVSNEIEKSHLWYMRYPIANSQEFLIVATTRPETMFGDTAVAVHPEDTRYQKYIGKKILLPLSNREIPIIADTYVDQMFGTGCVKITPAHDFNDYAVGHRHQLPLINVLTDDAHLNDAVPKEYRGLERFAARKKIIAELQSLDLIEKIEPHEHTIPRGDRSGVILEPYLTDQWFVKMRDMADAAIQAFEKNEVEFIPENWGKTYLQWLVNIEDWCISRQLWWGHRIPVWYDDKGNHYVGLHEADVRKRHHLNENIVLTQDNDVLDTWFSASLWPLACLGWPEHNADLQTFYPTSVLVTGFDIIFFWVARMVMMGLKFKNQVPFKQVVITGLIRDAQGQKMSKSKGNILDPIDLVDGITLEKLIEKRTAGLMQPQMEKTIQKQTEKEFPGGISASGTDALRFTFCALASTGRNINFDFQRLTGYRNFCNKIWNAARFVMMNVTEKDITQDPRTFTTADHWIISQLQQTIEQTHLAFAQYRFDHLAKILYEFTWNTYCDWYLEFAKCQLSDKNNHAQLRGTQYTLIVVLENLMRLLHPVIPFITEEIWQHLAGYLFIEKSSIMLQPYPALDTKKINHEADDAMTWLQQMIVSVRNLRGEMNVSPAKKISIILSKGSARDQVLLKKYGAEFMLLAKIEKISWYDNKAALPASATALVQALEIHIPLAGLIDKNEELKRLSKEIEKLTSQQMQLQTRLSNPTFVEKAPENVIAEVKSQQQHCEQTLRQLREHYQRIEGL